MRYFNISGFLSIFQASPLPKPPRIGKRPSPLTSTSSSSNHGTCNVSTPSLPGTSADAVDEDDLLLLSSLSFSPPPSYATNPRSGGGRANRRNMFKTNNHHLHHSPLAAGPRLPPPLENR